MIACIFFFFFFKQKTAYEMRISDWSSDVCSSDLLQRAAADEDRHHRAPALVELRLDHRAFGGAIGVRLQLHDLGLRRDRAQKLVETRLLQRRNLDILNIDRKSTRLNSSH